MYLENIYPGHRFLDYEFIGAIQHANSDHCLDYFDGERALVIKCHFQGGSQVFSSNYDNIWKMSVQKSKRKLYFLLSM